MDKKWRDAIVYHNGVQSQGGNLVTVFDPANPLGGRLLQPSAESPVCAKCLLHEQGASHPFMAPFGAEDPLVTIVFDSVSGKEDVRGELGSDGPPVLIRRLVEEMGFDVSRIRWSPTTLCAARTGKLPNFATKGNHCKIHLIQDLERHPPKLIMTVGSVALGLLSFKSNAQDWSGKVLTYRGWPDDWLTDPDFMLDRPDLCDPKAALTRGHPLVGPAPEGFRIPIVPVQQPRMIYMTQNPNVIRRWKGHIKTAFEMATQGVPALVYDRPYWRISTDPDEISDALLELINNPGTRVSYDTETNGVKPWVPGAAIVFMMFRWTDLAGIPRSIGFPWDYPESPIYPYRDELSPIVLEALYVSELMGHNTTFDILFTFANVAGANLVRLANAAKWDTWHMAYVMRQQRGTLGLEMIAYDWVPSLAGYEEDMTLLIELHRDLLHPGAGKGGHYANCPKDKWNSHLKPYVMGDVEVVYEAQPKIQAKLETAKTYRIPLADPNRHGSFRLYQPPSRSWVYPNVVSPASRMLMTMMGRGMYVDVDELARQEDIFPKKIREAKEKLRNADPKILDWCQQMEETEPGWELDLEKKDHLKAILFDSRLLNLPVNRLTDSGTKIYGDKPEDLAGVPREKLVEYAAMDKFTLNMMSVNHPEVRPLQEYKKIFKAYTTYVRPMRNSFSDKKHGGVDKKRREEVQHLMRDGCVHATFSLCGTRGGRLSASNPNLQQLPRDGLIKRLYTSRFGKRGCILQGDLSQIELRILAMACGDPSMVQAYQQGIDLHALTHSKIYGKQYDECTSERMEWLQSQGRAAEAKKIKLERKVAKCVDPDTLVSVDGRVMRVGSVHPGRDDDTFYPIDGRTIQGPKGSVPLKNFYSNGIKRRFMVCSLRGLIVCSENHKLLLADGRQVAAPQLEKGMVLANPTKMVASGDQNNLTPNISAFASKLELRALKVPEWLFNSTPATIRLFMAGWFDDNALIRYGSICTRTLSWKFAQDQMGLLNVLGTKFSFEVIWNVAAKTWMYQVNLSIADSWEYRELMVTDKRLKLFAPTTNRKVLAPNKVSRVIELEPGQLLDIEVGTPEHLFIANGLTQRNTVNFLTGYGGGAFGLQTSLASEQIYKTLEECEQILESFFDAYPSMRRYLSYYKDFILQNGVAVSILGRVRIFEEVFGDDQGAKNKALRAGCNHLIQSTASDIMLTCLTAIENVMSHENLESMMVCTVHDSLVVDTVIDELPVVHEIVYDVLNNIPSVLTATFGDNFDLSWTNNVPLAGDLEIGKNYLDGVKVPEHGAIDWDQLLAQSVSGH